MAPEATAFAAMPPSIPGLGSVGGFSSGCRTGAAGPSRASTRTCRRSSPPRGGARAGRRDVHVQRLRPAALRGCRPRQSAQTRRRARPTCTRRCRRFSVACTSISSIDSGGSGASSFRPNPMNGRTPRASRPFTCATTTATWFRCRRCSRRAKCRAAVHEPIQRVSRGAGDRRAGARVQLRASARRHRRGVAADAADRVRIRLRRPVIPGTKGVERSRRRSTRFRSCSCS